jgi:hypothetical protein
VWGKPAVLEGASVNNAQLKVRHLRFGCVDSTYIPSFTSVLTSSSSPNVLMHFCDRTRCSCCASERRT